MSDLEKKQQRKHFAAIRSALSPNEKLEKDAKIVSLLQAWIEKENIQTVFLFKAFRDEPDLMPLCREFSHLDVGLPVIDRGSPGKMEFMHFHPGQATTLNKYGIEEPEGDLNMRLRPDSKTLIVIPALAVDKTGVRLGYGGGYYDRYLAQLPEEIDPILVSAVYDSLFISQLPHESHDIRVNYVVTELAVTKISHVKK